MSESAASTSALDDAYASALAVYLADGSEEALARAYELGRAALTDGLGVVEMAALHARAVSALQQLPRPPSSSLQQRRLDAFFEEALTPFEMAFRGFKDAVGHLRHANEDLTVRNVQLYRAREATEAANRELEEFTAAVSHDLRGPMRRMAGFASILAEDYRDKLDDEGRAHVERIQKAAAQMGSIIEDLLRLSRVNRAELVRERVDLSARARDVVVRLREVDRGRAVDVVVADGIVVMADARLVGILLENVIGNAWKFTSKTAGARIEVGVREDGVVYVADNGAGFDPAHAARLFRPFQRLHADTAFEGTGVGLATVERIVRRHGGTISAEGAVDQGATIRFSFGTAGAPGGGNDG